MVQGRQSHRRLGIWGTEVPQQGPRVEPPVEGLGDEVPQQE